MDIQDLRIFARVAAVQSLSAVGTEFGLTAGTISKRLQALEQEISARLFERTTRSVRITPEGRVLLLHVERVLDEIERARSLIEDSAGRTAGMLKIAAPTYLGRRLVGPAVGAFLDVFPEIEVQVDLIDRCVSLQEDGYDVVVRSGALPDGTLIAKRLAVEPCVLVAAPHYLQRRGSPRAPKDLEAHHCLALNGERQWTFCKGVDRVAVRVAGRMSSNSAELLHAAALAAHGILMAPLGSVGDDIAAGRLVRVLSDYEVEGNAIIYALYASGRHQPPRLRAFLDFLAEWMRKAASSERPIATGTASATVAGETDSSVVPLEPLSTRQRQHAGRR